MLSTLSSLLPTLSSDPPPAPPPPREPEPPAPMNEPPRVSAERPVKDRPSGFKVQNETFIVVRPPPSKSNHPLNLQLQLIPPAIGPQHSKASSSTNSRRSVDLASDPPESPGAKSASTGSAAGHDDAREVKLRRRASTSSAKSSADSESVYSTSSSVASSTASFASSTSSRRIIVPLYNLSAHNVMANAVLDAGTDAKIAKFLKRGIEIIDLCIIEPTEIWGNATTTAAFTAAHDAASARTDTDSVASSEHLVVPPTPEPVAATPKRSRFGNLFNRNRSRSPARTPAPQPPKSPLPPPEPKQRPPEAHLSQPVLGLQSSIYSPVFPPVGKSAKSIVWVVRRWFKGNDNGLLGGLQRLNVRKDATAPQLPTVRFEWVRGSPPRSGTTESAAHSRAHTESTLPGSGAPSRRSSHIVQPAGGGHQAPGSQPSSPAPRSVDLVSHLDGDARSDSLTHETDDPESDAEDSETPWTCTLVISLPGDVSPSPSDLSVNRANKRSSFLSGIGSPAANDAAAAINPTHLTTPVGRKSFRLRLATLAPTPHHPKVVAQLKMPWPLPDVDVAHGVAHKRAPGGGQPEPRDGALIVSAEELKDIVCTSAFWVIVRENFGGISKKTRRGDGWNIRG